MLIKNMWLHFKKICIHKYYVRKYCWKMGLYWQGLTHDLSKFSPIEFWESAKYYQGDRSPIDACKEANGISYGWQHHKGRNPHHAEYWIDNIDNDKIKVLIMPKKYAMELLADYLGAGRAYMGKEFSYQKEFEWWQNKVANPNLKMHLYIRTFIHIALEKLTKTNDSSVILNKKFLSNLYDEIIRIGVKNE